MLNAPYSEKRDLVDAAHSCYTPLITLCSVSWCPDDRDHRTSCAWCVSSSLLSSTLPRSLIVLCTDRPLIAQILSGLAPCKTRRPKFPAGPKAGWLGSSTLPLKDIGSGSVVMDAREREKSQSRRPSIKRPWEEDIVLPEAGNTWFGATLPPIDPLQCRRTPTSKQAEAGGNFHNISHPDSREDGAKRARYEGGNDYIAFPEGKVQSQASRKSSRNPAIAAQILIPLPI